MRIRRVLTLLIHLLLTAPVTAQTPDADGPSASQPAPAASQPPSASQADELAAALQRPKPARIAAARRWILTGRYDDAATLLDSVDGDAALALPAALVRSELDERVGGYRAGIERLKRVESAGGESAAWRAALAGLLMEVGEYDAAIEQAGAALRLDAACMRARWLLGRLLETLGRDRDALAAYRWFDEQMHRSLPERADDLTWLGRGFLRYSAMTRHPQIKQRCRHVLQEVYQEAFDFVDAEYWPARLAAADLMLEKHNTAEAVEDYERVLAINPRATEARVGLARAALEDWGFERIEQQCLAALEINPNCAAAHATLGRGRMLERRYADAAECAEKALRINPRSIDALALLAAARRRGGDEAAAADAAGRVAAINPRCAELHYELGVWLSAARQYEAAEREFKQAIEFADWWSQPRTELGLMYMQSGQEAESRDTLEASWKLDPFNQQTFNTLELLDTLEAFPHFESRHFTFRFAAGVDATVIPFIADYMEGIHDELCGLFSTQLKRKTIIEMFPEHGDFSVRIAGRPWIATVGACTGPVIAMTAPRRGSALTPFNWAEVLRHEFTHTVTLAATGNRIPHWMTEGLAVHQEAAEKPWPTREMLGAALRTGRLFDLDTIDWGFMRPRRRDDRSLAYAQSEWMIEFIVEKWGFPKVLDLLRAYREGRTQAVALREVLQTDPAGFIDAFRPWAARQVAEWGLPTTPVGDVDDLAAEAGEDDADAAVFARLAEAHWYAQAFEECALTAREALELDEDQPLALELLGRLLVEQDDQHLARYELEESETRHQEAEGLLRRLHKLDPDNAVCLKYLARVEEWKSKDAAAAALWERYQKAVPRDPESYRKLAGLALKNGKRDAAVRWLEQAYRLDSTEPGVAERIAQAHAESMDWQSAETWLARAAQSRAYDVELYRDWGRAALAAGDLATAVRALTAARHLSPDDVELSMEAAAAWELSGLQGARAVLAEPRP